MNKKILFVLVTVFCSCFLAAGIYASSCPDVIKLEDPAYKKHKKGIVSFTHKKHYTDYKIGCGDCHHNDKGQPLNDLKEGDKVQRCIECHKIPGQVPSSEKKELKKIKNKKERQQKLLEYQAEAFHENCKDCHKEWNKKNGKKSDDGAPTSCKDCHPKN